MGRNAQTGEVFHLGADNQGGSSLGKWTFKDGVASLEVVFVAGDGQEGGLMIEYRLKDDNTMVVNMGAVTFTLIRAKTQG
jgi:hypothetical protein